MTAEFWAIDLISIIRTLGEGEAELEILQHRDFQCSQ